MIQDDNPRVEGTWMHSLDWLCSLLPSVELKIKITKCWKWCHHPAVRKIIQNSTCFPTNFNIQSVLPLILQDMRMTMPQKINYIIPALDHQKRQL